MIGLSLLYCSAGNEFDFSGFPYDLFTALEIPGDFLAADAAPRGLDLKRFKTVIAGRLAAPGVSREIALQNGNIIADFRRGMRQTFSLCGKSGISSTVADFGADRAINDAGFKTAFLRLLQSLTPALMETQSRLLLPARVPFLPGITAESYLSLLREIMSPQFGVCLDVHPHELVGKEFDIAAALHWLRFDIGAARLIYEPEAGNRLVAKLITPWRDYLAGLNTGAPALLCPMTGKKEIFEYEVHYLSDLLAKTAE